MWENVSWLFIRYITVYESLCQQLMLRTRGMSGTNIAIETIALFVLLTRQSNSWFWNVWTVGNTAHICWVLSSEYVKSPCWFITFVNNKLLLVFHQIAQSYTKSYNIQAVPVKMDQDSEDVLIFCAVAIACLGILQLTKKTRKQKRMWVNPFLEERKTKGRFATAVRNSHSHILVNTNLNVLHSFSVFRHDQLFARVQRKFPYECWLLQFSIWTSRRNLRIYD